MVYSQKNLDPLPFFTFWITQPPSFLWTSSSSPMQTSSRYRPASKQAHSLFKISRAGPQHCCLLTPFLGWCWKVVQKVSERSPNGGELERRNHQKKPRSQLPGLTPSQLRYILWLQFRVPLCGKSVDIGTGRTEERLPIIYMKGYHSAEKYQGGKEDCPLFKWWKGMWATRQSETCDGSVIQTEEEDVERNEGMKQKTLQSASIAQSQGLSESFV